MSVMDMIEFGTSAARRSFNALAPAPPGIMGVPIAILLAKRKRLAWWRTEHASLRRATNRLDREQLSEEKTSIYLRSYVFMEDDAGLFL